LADDGWQQLPRGGAEATRVELLHQLSVKRWRDAYAAWLTLAVGLGLSAWLDESEADRVTDLIRKAMQATEEWREATPTLKHADDGSPCWSTGYNDHGTMRCVEHGRPL
jgi:hypothetical protein